MGILGGFGRLLKGEPVFQPPTGSGSGQSSPPGQSEVPAAPHQPVQTGAKVIPQVEIERVEVHSDPLRSYMRVSVHIQNNSAAPVKINNIRILGTTRQLGNRQLKPGESYEFINVYDGARPTQTGGENDDVQVSFEDLSDDEFQSQHRVEFNQEADNTYSIKRIIYTAPKDI